MEPFAIILALWLASGCYPAHAEDMNFAHIAGVSLPRASANYAIISSFSADSFGPRGIRPP